MPLTPRAYHRPPLSLPHQRTSHTLTRAPRTARAKGAARPRLAGLATPPGADAALSPEATGGRGRSHNGWLHGLRGTARGCRAASSRRTAGWTMSAAMLQLQLSRTAYPPPGALAWLQRSRRSHIRRGSRSSTRATTPSRHAPLSQAAAVPIDPSELKSRRGARAMPCGERPRSLGGRHHQSLSLQRTKVQRGAHVAVDRHSSSAPRRAMRSPVGVDRAGRRRTQRDPLPGDGAFGPRSASR